MGLLRASFALDATVSQEHAQVLDCTRKQAVGELMSKSYTGAVAPIYGEAEPNSTHKRHHADNQP
jgi:hypothetical protein